MVSKQRLVVRQVFHLSDFVVENLDKELFDSKNGRVLDSVTDAVDDKFQALGNEDPLTFMEVFEGTNEPVSIRVYNGLRLQIEYELMRQVWPSWQVPTSGTS